MVKWCGVLVGNEVSPEAACVSRMRKMKRGMKKMKMKMKRRRMWSLSRAVCLEAEYTAPTDWTI